MKFNVLVVAAMVITSVNAGRHKRLPGYPKNNDGPAPILSLDLSDDDDDVFQGPGPSKGELGDSLNIEEAYGAVPTCDPVLLRLHDLQDKIRNLVTEGQSCLQTLHELHVGLGRSSNEGNDEFFESLNELKAKMETVEINLFSLGDKYHQVLLRFEGCSSESRDSMTAEDLMKLENFFDNALKSLDDRIPQRFRRFQ
ncbi:hypothetical protein BASA50_010513 [Batrachochytrium salamandrivorans]|uniref:Uncharacterized protein n=1 Tax=Batrachochytrium salamandrivorans TaxID=1357716 RepID=A0ABQ8F0Z8_9FUNG|nr:hypothetical protein BASA62_009279 [Batrachochytrium salamandrivorans]KAH6568299.1 hypothetical protein BASA60_008710 [Batrachochytrium salamandrivorans]KAH6588712.1 hypothetical protein BASA50_010513 [Batrachochytrium salamandrivorans]KAH6602893.1 hypothetical protein BASA61_000670 [Batrachochytrium salamandrivorans]KAH9249211.1 hypothetical protein BASA81_013060 [Batrachochytrium salamandrivorans]